MKRKSNPFFSVIIPVYNRPDYIVRSAASVLNQTYSDYELIIVDDGSTDNTLSVIQQFSDKAVILHQKNKGVSSARNLGISAAKGRFIALLDSDDIWKKSKLQRQYEFIGDHSGIRIFQCNENWIRGGRKVNPQKKHLKPSGDIFAESLQMCLVSPSAVVISKTVFEDYGLFDEDLIVCEDYDMWLRISSREKIYLQNEYLLDKTGGHEDQLSASCWGMDRFRIYSMIKLLEDDSAEKFLTGKQIGEILNVLKKKLEVLKKGAAKRNNDRFTEKITVLEKHINSERYSRKDCQFLLE
ncbi:MAG: glycosyltransferase [Spirochaetes bacterium]|nr:glycosyltransferase [Spirochaetota bacterium]